jgi:hypothetical protein
MQMLNGRSLSALAIALVGAGIAPHAHASCSMPDWANAASGWAQQQAASVTAAAAAAASAGANVNAPDRTIVGLWNIVLTSEGNAGIPDGTPLDVGYATWHSDGTELMNSSRPPKSGDFCMGTWKAFGPNTYKLHHVTLAWDPTGTYFEGPGDIRETVSLDRSGDAFSGTFVLDQFAPDGTTLLVELKGTIAGTRIIVD